MSEPEIRSIVCKNEDCGQESRPGYSRCWHHWMMHGYGESCWEWMSLHSLLSEVITADTADQDHPDSDDKKRGYFPVAYIEDSRWFGDGDRSDEYHQCYDLEEALEYFPDYDHASCSGMLDEMRHVWADGKLIALIYYDWCEFDDDEESDDEPEAPHDLA